MAMSTDAASSFGIVVGYRPADQLPAEVKALRLVHRCSMLMASNFGTGADANFDHGLYLALLDQAFAATSAVEAVVLLESGERRQVKEASGFAHVFATLAEPKEPLPEILFLRRGAASGLLLSEPYARVGGPSPYDDSYALSFFGDRATRDRFVAAVKELPSHCVGRITEGSAEPSKSGWDGIGRRISSVLGVRPSANTASVLARAFARSAGTTR